MSERLNGWLQCLLIFVGLLILSSVADAPKECRCSLDITCGDNGVFMVTEGEEEK